MTSLQKALSKINSSFFYPHSLSTIKFPIKNKSPIKTILNTRKMKQVLKRAPPFSSPLLIRSKELCKQSPAMNNTNKLGIKSPHDTNHKLSPFPIRNVNATANKKTEAYCKSFLFELFKVLFTKILNLIKYPISNPYKKSVSLHILLAFICHYKSKWTSRHKTKGRAPSSTNTDEQGKMKEWTDHEIFH